MKGHRYCNGDVFESHEFSGRSMEQVLRRVGKWIDTRENSGMVIALNVYDVDGLKTVVGAHPLTHELFVQLVWSPS